MGVVDQISHSVSAALDWKHLIEAVRFVVIHSIYAIFYMFGVAVFAFQVYWILVAKHAPGPGPDLCRCVPLSSKRSFLLVWMMRCEPKLEQSLFACNHNGYRARHCKDSRHLNAVLIVSGNVI